MERPNQVNRDTRCNRVSFYFSTKKETHAMDYGMIGKIEKAKRYAEDRTRFRFNKFDLTFHGDNNDHHVTYDGGVFSCDCEFFLTHKRCGHSMALEILLKDMLAETVDA